MELKKLSENILEKKKELGAAVANKILLDHGRTVVLSKIKNEMEASETASAGKAPSETKVERLAKADARYEKAIQDYAEAAGTVVALEGEVEALERNYEATVAAG